MGAATRTRERDPMLDHLHTDTDFDLPAADPSLLEELAVTGFRPFEEHDDPRPLPNADRLTDCLGHAMRQIEMAFADTRLEDDLEDVLWGFVNVFHRRACTLSQ